MLDFDSKHTHIKDVMNRGNNDRLLYFQIFKSFLLVAIMAIPKFDAAPLELPPGVDPSCQHTYPICLTVPLTAQQQTLNNVHAANVALENLKAQQQALLARAPYVPIVGPDGGVVRQGETVGPNGIIVSHN